MNWQCARAHLNYMHSHDKMTYEDFMKSAKAIDELAGYAVTNAPDYKALLHFGGKLTIADFTRMCNERTHALSAVRIDTDGNVTPVTVHPVDGNYEVALTHQMEAETFDVIRPTRRLKNLRDKQMAVIVNSKDVEGSARFNSKASQLFKIELHGDVLIVCLTKRVDVDHVDEYLCFTMRDYNEQFSKKTKKTKKEDEVDSMSKDEYTKIETEINKAFDRLEANESHDATVLSISKSKNATAKVKAATKAT